jgi:hypothetical protein
MYPNSFIIVAFRSFYPFVAYSRYKLFCLRFRLEVGPCRLLETFLSISPKKKEVKHTNNFFFGLFLDQCSNNPGFIFVLFCFDSGWGTQKGSVAKMIEQCKDLLAHGCNLAGNTNTSHNYGCFGSDLCDLFAHSVP